MVVSVNHVKEILSACNTAHAVTVRLISYLDILDKIAQILFLCAIMLVIDSLLAVNISARKRVTRDLVIDVNIQLLNNVDVAEIRCKLLASWLTTPRRNERHS